MVHYKWGDRTVKTKALALAGEYGDLFWTLEPSLMYVAGTEIFVRIYVANVTDADREYMLMAKVIRGDTELSEFPVKVDDKAWFEVEAENVVSLPCSLVVDYTDAALVLELYERSTSEITDSVVTGLYSAGTQNLPMLPGIPGVGFDIGSIMNLMLIMMVMVMMMKMVTGKKEEGGV